MNESGHKKDCRSGKNYGRKSSVLFGAIMLFLSLLAGGTLAYIVAATDQVTNQFEPARVACRVNVNSDNIIDVTNTGNVDAYIRASYVVNWMDSTGSIYAIAPATGEYSVGINSTDWQLHTDGYYYYKHRVTPEPDNVDSDEDTTKYLVTFVSVTGTPPSTDYTLNVEVVAEAIQADGAKVEGGTTTPAYIDAWIESVNEN